MGLVILLIILAVLFGVGGLILEGLQWLLIIAAVLFIAGLVFGGRARGKGV